MIATRHDSHAELAAQALEAGKAVFLEKPLAIDVGGLERVARAGRRRWWSTSTAALRRRPTRCARTSPAGPTRWSSNAASTPARCPRTTGSATRRSAAAGWSAGAATSSTSARRSSGGRCETVAVAPLGAGPDAREDSFVLTLSYADGSLGVITYVATGSPRMAKERIEVLGGGRSAVIDDFRRTLLYGTADAAGRFRLASPRTRATRPRCGGSSRSSRKAGRRRSRTSDSLETTRATLIAREALAAGFGPQPIAPDVHARS